MATPHYQAHPTSIVEEGADIGPDCVIGAFTFIGAGARVGRGCRLGHNVYVGPHSVIGDGCVLQHNVAVYEGVVFENEVFCGPSAVFTNLPYPRAKSYPDYRSDVIKTLVREGASLGANSTVVCGNTIGRYAFVAAGAVVTKHVADYALVKGMPASQDGWICACGRVLPDFYKEVQCAHCGRHYELRHGQLAPMR